MIRPTIPTDDPTLLTLAQETGVFRPIEIQALEEVLSDYHATNREHGHRSATFESEGQYPGLRLLPPAAMTDRTWYLYWIAVSKHAQAGGIGGKLMEHVEDEIRRQRGRILLIETSSLAHYAAERRFYLKHNYEQVAELPDYYADDDHMIVFRKRFSA